MEFVKKKTSGMRSEEKKAYREEKESYKRNMIFKEKKFVKIENSNDDRIYEINIELDSLNIASIPLIRKVISNPEDTESVEKLKEIQNKADEYEKELKLLLDTGSRVSIPDKEINLKLPMHVDANTLYKHKGKIYKCIKSGDVYDVDDEHFKSLEK